MTTRFLATDISWDEAPHGIPVLNSYPDPLSKGPPWTIGFGSTGKDIGRFTHWTPEQCIGRRDETIATLIVKFSQLTWWNTISDVRQDVFINMAYQMGFEDVMNFKRTILAAIHGLWETVAADLRLSLWDHQTPERANRLIEQVRTNVRVPCSYDSSIKSSQDQVQVQQEGTNLMSIVSSAFRFVYDHVFATVARQAASTNPSTAAQGISDIQTVTMPATGSPNSTAGQASSIIANLEDGLNNLVMEYVKAAVDQIPGVGGVAEVTGLDQKAADAAKVALIFGEQHAMTYLASLFSAHHVAVNSVTVPAGATVASAKV